MAAFSNLEPDGIGPDSVEYFRRNYPDFVPQGWWDYQSDITDIPQWRFNQNYLRGMWKERAHMVNGRIRIERPFPDDLYSRMLLTLSVFDPRVFKVFSDDFGEKPAFVNLDDIDPKHYYPYHKAAFFLFENPWRARFCVECNKRFVAAESQNTYCGEACFHVRRNRQKLEWWNREGKRLRAVEQKRRRHVRLPKGPKRAQSR